MRTFVWACLALVVALRPAAAQKTETPTTPVPHRVALADAVVIGKVTAAEPRTVAAPRLAGQPGNDTFHVFAVQADEVLRGPKDLKQLRVASPVPNLTSTPPDKREAVLRQYAALAPGKEMCFFVKKHHGENFFVATFAGEAVEKKDPRFGTEVEQARRCCQLLADPDAGLKAKEKADRVDTAAMLVVRYRTPRTFQPKEEPVPAAESKLILEALAEADWTEEARDRGPLRPLTLFIMLGVKRGEGGWEQPRGQDKLAEAARQWCKDNAGKVELRRFVEMKGK